MIVFHGKRLASSMQVRVIDNATGAKQLLSPPPWMAPAGWRWDWGCYCPGSLLLALALLYHGGRRNTQTAVSLVGAYLEDVVIHLPKKEWMVTQPEVVTWINSQHFGLAEMDSRAEGRCRGR